LVDSSNQRTQATLAERHASLEQLVAALDSKSSDLDERLTRFSSTLDQSLEAAAERAREVARLTADSTTSGALAISETFDAIRNSAEDEHKRMTDAVHGIYQQAIEESNAVFTQAAERFAEVVDGLKRMTAEMQQELEITRSELRKGIFELPQETADSTAQMRRVIVDQIEALAELNRIVARHGRGLDAVEPAARRMETVEAGARRSAAHDEAPLTNGEPARGRPDIAGIGPPPVPNRRTDAPSLSPGQAAGGRSGWLSELLTRASQESTPIARAPGPNRESPPQAPPERNSLESLDSLAVDIARMIDNDAAAELWDRYNRGERNVFTRKLYTMQGQRAFEEIRRRYRSDRDFMRTVDRYIGEFERLLEEIARDDRSQTAARSYLTSETGKVYTMLAHAAGRFD
jgi:predicted RNA-binding protein Jag